MPHLVCFCSIGDEPAGVQVVPSGKTQTVTVWTKALSAAAVDNVAKLPKEGVDRATQKVLLGYRPPFSEIVKLTEDQRCNHREEVADEQLVPAEIKVLLQIDCEHETTRRMSVVVTHGGRFGALMNLRNLLRGYKFGRGLRAPHQTDVSYLKDRQIGE